MTENKQTLEQIIEKLGEDLKSWSQEDKNAAREQLMSRVLTRQELAEQDIKFAEQLTADQKAHVRAKMRRRLHGN
jgi:hypothetical protein